MIYKPTGKIVTRSAYFRLQGKGNCSVNPVQLFHAGERRNWSGWLKLELSERQLCVQGVAGAEAEARGRGRNTLKQETRKQSTSTIRV